MDIAVIGTGYVGLVSGVCFAEVGNNVICVDQDKTKIDKLQNFISPIYEPGIEELMEKNIHAGRLAFTTDLAHAISQSELIIIAVGTPSLPNGEANLSYIEQASMEIGKAMNGYKIIATKSTVPVGTNEHIQMIIAMNTQHAFDVVSIPEFLREGSAIDDTLHPDRIVLGLDNPSLAEPLTDLHRAFTDQIFVTSIRSAEMIKYASNAFLATKISFINEISNICEKVGADVTEVAKGMGKDKRIGSSFLNAGIGYGGSCFPKDTDALIQIAGNVDYEFQLLKSVVEVNKSQRYKVISKLEASLGLLSGKVVGIWGLSFKPNTDDIRYAPSIEIVETLIRAGATLKLYDPIAMDKFRERIDHPSIQWCENAMEAAVGADAICLLTDWEEFKTISLSKLIFIMDQPILIDGRNVYSQEQIQGTGLKYYSVGRPDLIGVSRPKALTR
ncbi:UDP-glucose/GDP-mannose dehydrogenase family protein [Paenibacillus sp. CGMCC 1.16610]|uniref:UDP-glucose 6-dehydrogenase n=1 Tax=Paenibacillus anseongense TaxID=2682845 RepID=A0ABW9UFX2_9BACL|nr:MULTISPECIES: UDP-glucose/GDP-mannose dehydrogenase family protein [Paenibacillus]MBA2938555.1 UDP-glucose/GDP-mannose dehydrogenase family protein [Paenibacillus sp. CGMCC 1.16610]MVQ38748.1 nucleotide sugar dehydrogenase [Paenibacillus anseongense]